jgi:hypothetical protein
LSDELLDIKAQLLALRQFAAAHYASILVMRPGPVSAVQSLARDGIAKFEQALEACAGPEASQELNRQSVHHLELIWNDVEQALRQRGYST